MYIKLRIPNGIKGDGLYKNGHYQDAVSFSPIGNFCGPAKSVTELKKLTVRLLWHIQAGLDSKKQNTSLIRPFEISLLRMMFSTRPGIDLGF